MPLPIVHLLVAEKVLNHGVTIENESKYFLGSISPDAIHIRENTGKVEKRITHFIDNNKRRLYVTELECENFINKFVKSNINYCDRSFLIGYSVHVLTDAYWINRFYKNFFNKKIEEQKLLDIYYRELQNLDYLLFERYKYEKPWECIKNATSENFVNILTSPEITEWKNNIIYKYEKLNPKKRVENSYIDNTEIEDFIQNNVLSISNQILRIFNNIK